MTYVLQNSSKVRLSLKETRVKVATALGSQVLMKLF